MVEFEGMVEQITFRNADNGWTVMQLRKGRERVTAVGSIAMIEQGERISLTGEWVEHPDYGRQIKITACTVEKPSTVSGVERYLGSGLIRGLGPSTAKIIVQTFGSKALDIIETQPERLREIPGIGAKRAAMIAESYLEQASMRQSMLFMQQYGLSPSMATKVFKVYGARAQDVISHNPYQLVHDIRGIGFQTADKIAEALGVDRNSEFRIQCGIIHTLREAEASNGHVFLPYEQLREEAYQLLSVDPSLVEREIQSLLLLHEIVIQDIGDVCAVYSERMYSAEADVAVQLVQLMRSVSSAKADSIDDRIYDFEREHDIQLCEEQRQAVSLAVSSGMAVITGGPGTGKTTIIRCIINLMRKHGNIALCAPTGRAAKRMSEATGMEAKTIHRMLEYSGEDGESFARNRKNPLEAGVVIVDEMSMVDLTLMRSLLSALSSGTRLVLVGDADQLPSVGAGNVLRDILDSEVIPTVRLRQIFRQSDSSMIVTNAHMINDGEMPIFNRRGSDFFLERTDTPSQTAQTVVQLVQSRLPAYAGVDPLEGIQVLSPTKKGDAGVYALNKALQQAFNPKRPGEDERIVGEQSFRAGDKVMQTRNNYSLEWECGKQTGEGVFNGDMGFVTHVSTRDRTVTVKFDDERVVEYDESDVEELDLAYCVSVHKSQGSEFQVVVMPVLTGPRMLMTRNLLYTAVTRARTLVVLVGRDSAIKQMVDNNYITRRYSALKERLQALAKDMPGALE